jgi:hypothetical protein
MGPLPPVGSEANFLKGGSVAKKNQEEAALREAFFLFLFILFIFLWLNCYKKQKGPSSKEGAPACVADLKNAAAYPTVTFLFFFFLFFFFLFFYLFFYLFF